VAQEITEAPGHQLVVEALLEFAHRVESPGTSMIAQRTVARQGTSRKVDRVSPRLLAAKFWTAVFNRLVRQIPPGIPMVPRHS
jgi:hypothetical protein